jgi:chromosome partitioning protein
MIIAVINEKGGVGKTTTVATLGHALAARGLRVLLIDLDPQANLTAWIGADERPERTIANALADKAAMPYCIGAATAGGAHLAYGARAIAAVAEDLRDISTPALALRRALRGLDYDRILVDCPPGLGVLSVNALCAADELLIPVNSQSMALSGVQQLGLSVQQLVYEEAIAQAPVAHLVLTMYDSRRALARGVREFLDPREHVYGTTIRASARIAECYGNRQTIFDYAPKEGVADDYTQLAEEMHGAPQPAR